MSSKRYMTVNFTFSKEKNNKSGKKNFLMARYKCVHEEVKISYKSRKTRAKVFYDFPAKRSCRDFPLCVL